MSTANVIQQPQTPGPTSAEFFDAKYRADPDPWKFADDPYEQSRYRAIYAALSGRRYYRAFEPGCSVGVLTKQLAELCDSVEAWDISPAAVQQAQLRCRTLSNINIRVGALTAAAHVSGFDLIVFSEIGYYFTGQQLAELLRNLIQSMPSGGTFLAAHWLGSSPDHLLSGDHVHDILRALPGLTLEHAERHERFRLDRWSRA